MIIESIELKNYRNYICEKILFDDATNILYGNNAQGKTNILEAIYLSATTKSHKNSKDRDIISFEKEEAHIKLFLTKNQLSYRIDIHLKKNNKKGIAVNGIPIKKISDLFGIINVVIFSPEDLELIKRGPSERRRFLDLELCQIDKMYVHNLVNYNKIIVHRNKLLKEYNHNNELIEMLNLWDIQLAEYGSKIMSRRIEFIVEINSIIKNIHKKLTNDKEILILSYESTTSTKYLYNEILKNREKDIKFRNTSVGPHRDDVGFYINDLDIKKYGSQGQQRTSALSLKLAEIELIKKITKDTPVLLLDDVLSELDNTRQMHLLNSLTNVQTIITCTGLDDFIKNRFNVNRIYQVIEGKTFDYNQGKTLRKEKYE